MSEKNIRAEEGRVNRGEEIYYIMGSLMMYRPTAHQILCG
jgi:hypothetical protein